MKAVYYSLGVMIATALVATVFQVGYMFSVRLRDEGDPEDTPFLDISMRESEFDMEFLIRGIIISVVPAVLVFLLSWSSDISSSQTCIDHIGKIVVHDPQLEASAPPAPAASAPPAPAASAPPAPAASA